MAPRRAAAPTGIVANASPVAASGSMPDEAAMQQRCQSP
jgi:hypothetical protein